MISLTQKPEELIPKYLEYTVIVNDKKGSKNFVPFCKSTQNIRAYINEEIILSEHKQIAESIGISTQEIERMSKNLKFKYLQIELVNGIYRIENASQARIFWTNKVSEALKTYELPVLVRVGSELRKVYLKLKQNVEVKIDYMPHATMYMKKGEIKLLTILPLPSHKIEIELCVRNLEE